VRTEHANYFKALEQHPYLLAGTEVPAIGREGMQTLRDVNEAREWQEAVKSILVSEVRSRAGKSMEESKSLLDTVHSSIALFQENTDLVPGTKDFDVELANRFAELAKPYELRVEGKLRGYSIPVQPIINQLRGQVTKEREARKAAAPPVTPPASTGSTGAGAPASAPGAPATPPETPQAGITSKAGSGDQAEDFSTLFGTIGLPNLRI